MFYMEYYFNNYHILTTVFIMNSAVHNIHQPTNVHRK